MTHRLFLGFTACLTMGFAAVAIGQPKAAGPLAPSDIAPLPQPIPDLVYAQAFFPDTEFDDAIPTPESILGFEVGDRAAKHAEIEACFKAWAEASDRAQLFQYATTYEGRPLYYMVISSPQNIARLDDIKAGMNKLADPRTLDEGEGDRLLESLPAVAWLGYSIHGDETSGSDASLAVAYYLVASTGEAIDELLNDTLIIIDPMMNPDGRDRYLQQIAEHRGANPNVDDQSLLHTGYWPAGRGNHYMFDLNRDWIFGVHPETRGRIKAVGEWRPLLFVDAHEMGPQDTYLFSPPRDPVNPFHPARRRAWNGEFAKDQAAAFDQFGWRYYTGEWNDNWYPGYSDAWASLRGAVGILYEQAGLSQDGVKRPEDRVMTYREAVHHQVVSSMANIKTLEKHRELLLKQFLNERQYNLRGGEHEANRVYLILPSENNTRRQNLLDLLELQGVEMHVATRGFVADGVIDQLGQTHERRTIPAGTVIIAASQPDGPLVRALLEFDPRMSTEFLQEERRELLRFGRSRMYDTTAWNLTMMNDVDAYMLATGLPGNLEPYSGAAFASSGVENPDSTVGFIIDGADDASVVAAARLMDRGVQVRLADRSTNFDGFNYARGSIVVTRTDNRNYQGDLVGVLHAVCNEVGVRAMGIESGFATGDEPDLGGEHFVLLNRPSIAILARGSTSPNDVGAIWFNIDQRLGVRSTLLDINDLNYADLRRYNVVIVPELWGNALDENALKRLNEWVESGGTLIAAGRAAARLATESSGLSSVRELPDVLEDLDSYRLAILREWLGRHERVDPAIVWSNSPDSPIKAPLADFEPPVSDKDELKRLDEWQSLFMPQGAFVTARTDDRSWLTCGADQNMAVFIGDDPILMVKDNANAAVRIGTYLPLPRGVELEDDEISWSGWAPIPAGQEMRLRMSGLVWPEAAHRLANAAYATTERHGRGQVVLFASPPTFRGAAMGTTRLFLNAVVFGPGFAQSHIIQP